MLPFLKEDKKKADGIVQKTRTPDSNPEENQDDSNAGLEACAHDLIQAIHSRNAKAVAEALQAAFEIADSSPHNEGEHTNEEE